MIFSWKFEDWTGSWNLKFRNDDPKNPPGFHWTPRRVSYEILKLLSKQDLPNDPDAWEAWLKAHPNLVWDDKLKRLVDAPAR